MRVLAVRRKQAETGERPYELMELPKNCIQIRVDIRMIVFDVRNCQGPRTVMDKLSALIEERSIVLVRFNDEVLRPTETS